MGQSEPNLLYSIDGISAYHVSNGQETPITSNPSTLSMLMVPTTTYNPFSQTPEEEEDFYLHLQLYPNLDLPLPATTQIFRKFPRSYLIPRQDLETDGSGPHFTRIEFPENRSQDDVDTFETILAQCTAFLEKAAPPSIAVGKGKTSGAAYDPYDPSTSAGAGAGAGASSSGNGGPSLDHGYYAPGLTSTSHVGSSRDIHAQDFPDDYSHDKSRQGGYVPGQSGSVAGQEYGYASGPAMSHPGGHDNSQGGRLVLVDEQDGRIVGELSEGFNVIEEPGVEHGSKAPVEITLPDKPGVNKLVVAPIDESYLDTAMHPAYASSSIVSKAAVASRFIVTTASLMATAIETGTNKFTSSTKPNTTPLTFNPTTHDRIRKIHTFTTGASGFSSKTVGKVQHIAQNIGARMAGKADDTGRAIPEKSGPPAKPGLLNKSMIAFSTIADGIDAASKHLLHTGSASATTMVGHRYGDEARNVAHGLTSSVKNVGLVYVDAAGVSRRAVVKSVAKGMVLGSVKGGGEVVVTSGDGTHGQLLPPGTPGEQQKQLIASQSGDKSPYRSTTPQPSEAGSNPPPYQLPSAVASATMSPPPQATNNNWAGDEKPHPGGNFF